MDAGKLAEMISEFLDPVIQAKNTQIIVLLITLMVVTVGNVLLQLFLKNRDVKNIIKTKRAEHTIQAFHELFSSMECLCSFMLTFDPKDQQSVNTLTSMIRNLRRQASIYRLSLTKGAIRIVEEYADYCSIVLTRLSSRDIRQEDRYLERFKTEYCRL